MFNPIAWFIAKRYLFSKKSHSVINKISIISVSAIAIPAAAMVILLSVTNGLNDFIRNLNSTFDPNIRIALSDKADFDENQVLMEDIAKIPNIKTSTKYIEGDCVVSLGNKTMVITLRGIDSTYLDNFPLGNVVVHGKHNKFNMLMGSGVAFSLGYGLGLSGEVTLYAPSRTSNSILGISKHFNSNKISVSGIFMLDTYTDSKYSTAPIKFVQNLFGKPNKISAIGITISDIDKMKQTVKEIKKVVPPEFEVKSNLEQRELDYLIIEQEKIAIYIMLTFIMIIASLTLISSVIMMMIEKKEQIETIKTIGGDSKLIKDIFKYQSLIMTIAGGVLGIIIGVVFCVLQQIFGFIHIDSSAVLIDTYPVLLNFKDIILVLVAIIFTGYIIAAITTATIESHKKDSKYNE